MPTPSVAKLFAGFVVSASVLAVAVSACSGGSGGSGGPAAAPSQDGGAVDSSQGSDAASPPQGEAAADTLVDTGPADGASQDGTLTDGAQPDGSQPDVTLTDAASEATADSTSDAAADATDAAATNTVTFEYTPGWSGVTAVQVVGGFGLPTDWKPLEPLVNLVSNGHGGFTGTSELPNGTYSYLYLVTGDEAAPTPATYARYYVDPANPDYVACPPASPTFTDAAPQPCSQVTVPQPTAPTLYHVRGSVTDNGVPEANYLVMIERDEIGSHHYPANRTNTEAKVDGGVDGGGGEAGAVGTFDLIVAKGRYQLQVLHPTFLAQTDEQRNPITLQAMRRAISSAVEVAADTTFPNVDVAYTAAEYDALAPRGDGDGGATLPTSFTYTIIVGSHQAQVAIYGPGKTVGDPWWESAIEKDGGSTLFDGGFDLSTGAGTAVEAGTQYWWGVWQYPPASDAGVTWSNQSMVFPITWE
jgi:hypothetical protein